MTSTLEVLTAAKMAFYDNKPTILMKAGATQSISNATITPLAMTVIQFDNWGGWSSGSNTRYTVPVSGIYAVSGLVVYPPFNGGARDALLMQNGSLFVGGQSESYMISSGSYQCLVVPPILVSAVVGDYFQLGAYQTSGGTQTTGFAGSLASSLTVTFERFA